MTREELAANDGRDGRPAYVAVNGKVYDVSASPRWRQGDHEGMHRAGADLGQELLKAPHVRAVIERFPVVGDLEPEAPPRPPATGRGLLLLAALVGLALVILLLFLI